MKKIWLVAWIGVAALQMAPAEEPVNKGTGALALAGNDPVALYNDLKPAAGSESITATHNGATYRFASEENKMAFEKDPAKFVPAYGGYCAFGVSVGQFFDVDYTTAQVVGGRLMLNKNPDVRKEFDKDRDNRVKKADEQWPKLVAKAAKKKENS